MADKQLLGELDRDLWQPFVRTYAALDADGFLALYGPELIRAGGPSGEVQDYAQFAAATRDFVSMVRERGDALGIEFAFTERLAAGELASERGVFRLTATLAGGEQRVRYGRFHTLARRGEDGRWRFVADYDSPDGADPAEFAAASGAAPAGEGAAR
jgi:ketosteroid isomerase-like protein